MNFIVHAPTYTNASAGIRVLHRLATLLTMAGHGATMAPLGGGGQAGDAVRVVPEIDGGTYDGRVVRYCLNKPGVLGGPTRYGEDELVLYYAEEFREAAQAASSTPVHRLTVNVTEPEWFYRNERIAKMFDAIYLGKCEDRDGEYAAPAQEPSRLITRAEPFTRTELGAILQRTRTLWTFDDTTMLAYEALLCGARVMVRDGNEWREVPMPERSFMPPYHDDAPARELVRLCKERWS